MHSTTSLKARTVYGLGLDEPLLMVRRGQFSYFHQDGLGSVTAATDSRGVLVEAYRYRAFGESRVFDPAGTIRSASSLDNPFRFTGREFDGETGLYYYRRRYYAQHLGRFLSPDPFPASLLNSQSLHRYSYVENNPINRLDPFGLRAEAAEIPDSRLDRMREQNSPGIDGGVSGGGGGGGSGGGGPPPPSAGKPRDQVEEESGPFSTSPFVEGAKAALDAASGSLIPPITATETAIELNRTVPSILERNQQLYEEFQDIDPDPEHNPYRDLPRKKP